MPRSAVIFLAAAIGAAFFIAAVARIDPQYLFAAAAWWLVAVEEILARRRNIMEKGARETDSLERRRTNVRPGGRA